ncbi:hypothetical protein TNCT_661911 [Trichonephila clavata]|uniref:Uncharacterized protein n=1 Tax=Trichonephila clavata TaxID=2740835 RepID=A0A8X6FMQ5_TRICU|nr:hypothetical protein TNCT_661911 [Trichonephila clavata]
MSNGLRKREIEEGCFLRASGKGNKLKFCAFGGYPSQVVLILGFYFHVVWRPGFLCGGCESKETTLLKIEKEWIVLIAVIQLLTLLLI